MTGRPGQAPLGEAVREPARGTPVGPEQCHAPRGENAVRSPAVGDDLRFRREAGEKLVELLERDRQRARDVAREVLLAGADVEDRDLARSSAGPELLARDGFELVGRPQVRGNGEVDLGKPLSRHCAEAGQELVNVVSREPVVDSLPVPAGLDKPHGAEHFEVRGSEGDAHVAGGGE